jgi:hypothetical protein
MCELLRPCLPLGKRSGTQEAGRAAKTLWSEMLMMMMIKFAILQWRGLKLSQPGTDRFFTG